MTRSDKFWDRKAKEYARSPISDEASYQKKLSDTQKFFTPDMNILEFGCGTGTTAIYHAPYVQHIEAVDISENMLEIGRTKAREACIDNIRFTRGTLTEFNAESESFDAVLGLNVIHLLPNRKDVLAEAARILKPGGVFVSSTVCMGNSYIRFIKLLAPLGKFMGIMPDVFILTKVKLAKEIQDAGFTIEVQWQHGMHNMVVFIIARKIDS
ncbi:2-methoxy-6-polyprenyl-1,4-benzoquinol methylase, mitochondrial [Microbulbifer sp. NBRC 101763]|uniref:class I SAM-dependent methyltransferase n=1 Tax=Microbulbifer sp. NBRC 101763 TaxID=1113820 RepID=UPI0030A5F49D